MSATWKNLCISAAAGVALFAAANVLVYRTSGFFQREREYHATVARALDKPALGILLMGDSHVAKIPNAYLAPDVHNVAAGGDGYRECYAKLRYLLGRSSGIRKVLLSVDYHMFGAGRVQSSNRSFVDRYLLATGSALGHEKGRLSSLFNLVPLFNDDFVQYLKKDLRLRLQGAAPRSAEKHAWQELPEQVRQSRAVSTGRMDHQGVGTVREPMFWYERIVELAKSHDVEIVAIRLPADPGYLAQLPGAGRATIDQDLSRAGVRSVVDLGAAVADPAYFEDEDHVNARGAALVVCLLEESTRLPLGERSALGNCAADAQLTGGAVASP